MTIFRAVCLLILLLGCALLAPAQTATSFPVTVPAGGLGSTIELRGAPATSECLNFGILGNGCAGCSGPTYGTLSAFEPKTGVLVYTPPANFTGTVTFQFDVGSVHCSTGAQSGRSSPATVTITVTSDLTPVRHRLIRADGTPMQGTVTATLLRQADGSGGLTPVLGSVSATLDSQGWFQMSLVPSKGLSPQSFYEFKLLTTNPRKEESLGVYEIPASTTTIGLPAQLFGADRQVKFTLASQAALNAALARSLSLNVFNDAASLVGTRPGILFQNGANFSFTVTDDSGNNRLIVRGDGISGGGSGTVASSTAGQLARFTAGTTVTGMPFGGAHYFLSAGAANNALEWKQVSCSSGVTCNLTPGALSITGSLLSLNSQTGLTQTFAVQTNACGSGFSLNSASNTHTICAPPASPTASGYINTGNQSIVGAKTLLGNLSTDIPLIVQQASGGSEILQEWRDSSSNILGAHSIYGTWHKFGNFGDQLAAPGAVNNGYTLRVSQLSSNLGTEPQHGFASTISYDGGATTGYIGAIRATANMAATGTFSTSGTAFPFAARLSFSHLGAGNLDYGIGAWSELYKANTSTWTNAYGSYVSATVDAGIITNLDMARIDPPNTTGGGTITNLVGLRIGDMNAGGSSNFSLYTGNGKVSLGAKLEWRSGASGVSAAGTGSLGYDNINHRLMLSVNGGQPGRVVGVYEGSNALDFDSMSTGTCAAPLTITVPNAVAGKPAFVGVPTASAINGVIYTWRADTGQVHVTACNFSGSTQNPASGTFTAYVAQ